MRMMCWLQALRLLYGRAASTDIESMTQLFGTFDGPLKGEPENLSIVVGDSVAWVNGISHIFG
jgi:ketosteroid isomerase-like protein